ncbi:MAG TPA: hypothetical protein DIC42_06940 [Holosporales bacterium]|nr:hypothetical protein [Holosporales bacterium]
MENDMYKEKIKLPVFVVMMTQILFASAPDTEKNLTYVTVAQFFNYQRLAEEIEAPEEAITLDKNLQFGVSEEALRFSIRTLISVALTLKAQHKTQQHFNEVLKRGFKGFPKNGFVMKVTDAIITILKAEDNGDIIDLLHAASNNVHNPEMSGIKVNKKYTYYQKNALARLVVQIYTEVLDKLNIEQKQGVAEPVQHEICGDPTHVSVASFDRHYALPEAKRFAREALLYKTKEKERALNAYLKTKLIGQDGAIDGFTNGIFCHEKGLLMEDFLQQMKQVQGYNFFTSLYEERKPSVILLMGPSGTGKTAMFTLAMNFLNKPYGIGSGADMTKAGYVGGKPENAIRELFEKADTIEDAERGAVLYDEICKLGGSGGGSKDEFTSAGQHGLLTIIEGTKDIMIEQKTPIGTIEIPFSGRRVLYVLAGAFSELIAHKKQSARSEFDGRSDYITDEHLIAFGLKRELVNRVRTIVSVKPFTEEHILQIMAFQDSPLKQVLTDFEDNGLHVVFDAASLNAFAKFSVQEGFGARNLSRQLQAVITLARQTQKSSSVSITAENVLEFQRLYHPQQPPHPMYM